MRTKPLFVLYFALLFLLTTAGTLAFGQATPAPKLALGNMYFQSALPQTAQGGSYYSITLIGNTLFVRYTDKDGKSTLVSLPSGNSFGPVKTLLQAGQDYVFPEGKTKLKLLSFSPTPTLTGELLVRVQTASGFSLVKFNPNKAEFTALPVPYGYQLFSGEFTPWLMSPDTLLGQTIGSYPLDSAIKLSLKDGSRVVLAGPDVNLIGKEPLTGCCLGTSTESGRAIVTDLKTGDIVLGQGVLRVFEYFPPQKQTSQIVWLTSDGKASKIAEGVANLYIQSLGNQIWPTSMANGQVLLASRHWTSGSTDPATELVVWDNKARQMSWLFSAYGNGGGGDHMGLTPVPQFVLDSVLDQNGDVYALVQTTDNVVRLYRVTQPRITGITSPVPFGTLATITGENLCVGMQFYVSTGNGNYNGNCTSEGKINFVAIESTEKLQVWLYEPSAQGGIKASIMTNQVKLEVIQPPPPTATLTASPASIVAGDKATLTWSTTDSASTFFDQGIGNVPVSGSRQVSPLVTTTYTLTASGAGGTTTKTATVTVAKPVPKITGLANPFSGEDLSALAPNAWVEVHGSSLCSVTKTLEADPGTGKFPIVFGGCFVHGQIDGEDWFFQTNYVSPGQVNILTSGIPVGRKVLLFAHNQDQVSAPLVLDVVGATPGLLMLDSVTTYVQKADGTFVYDLNVLAPKEVFTLYGVGFGQTTPSLPDGPAPLDRLFSTQFMPTIQVGGKDCVVTFSGLTPGWQGLYQINAYCPELPSHGDLGPTLTPGKVTYRGQTLPLSIVTN